MTGVVLNYELVFGSRGLQVTAASARVVRGA